MTRRMGCDFFLADSSHNQVNESKSFAEFESSDVAFSSKYHFLAVKSDRQVFVDKSCLNG